MKNEQERKRVFEEWQFLGETVSSMGDIIKNPTPEEGFKPEEIEKWTSDIKNLHVQLTHVANSTLRIILDEATFDKHKNIRPCPHCKCPMLDEGAGPNVCENPVCPENRY